jgi:hypothetical protein
MNTKTKCNLIILSLLAFAGAAAGELQKSFFSVQDILSGWQSNYGALKSMKVSYTQNIISDEPPQKGPYTTIRPVKWIFVQRTEDGVKFRSLYSSAEKGFDDINSVEEMTFDGIHQRSYSPARNSGQIYSGIFTRNVGTENRLKRFLLSEPEINSNGIESEDSRFCSIIKSGLSDSNLMTSVRPYLEEMAGQMCHVVDIEFLKKDKTWGKGTTIWVAHEKGMLPMKIQEFNSDTDAIARERTIEQIDFAKTPNGGLWYPKKAYELMNLPQSIGVIKIELTVTEFVPNIKTDPNVFQLDFPNGTQVSDAEMGISYTVGVK